MSTEVFSTIRVPDNVRQKLKILSAQRNIPMYRLVEAWLDMEETCRGNPELLQEDAQMQARVD